MLSLHMKQGTEQPQKVADWENLAILYIIHSYICSFIANVAAANCINIILTPTEHSKPQVNVIVPAVYSL